MLPSGAFEPTTTQVDRVQNSSSRQHQMRQHQNKLRSSGNISRNSSNSNNFHQNNSLKDSNAVNHRILSTGEYSDLKLVCHGREYQVHKAIVCPQVAFLEGACREGFREAATGVVDLSQLCESSDLLQKIINFLYVHDIQLVNTNTDTVEAAKIYGSLYIHADKLGIPALKEHCMSRVRTSSSLLPHRTIYELTEMIYAQTMPADDFRHLLIRQVCQRAQRVIESDDARAIEEFRNFCEISEDIRFDVIRSSLTFGGGMLNRQSFQVVI